jgi:hypothetical protein
MISFNLGIWPTVLKNSRSVTHKKKNTISCVLQGKPRPNTTIIIAYDLSNVNPSRENMALRYGRKNVMWEALA